MKRGMSIWTGHPEMQVGRALDAALGLDEGVARSGSRG